MQSVDWKYFVSSRTNFLYRTNEQCVEILRNGDWLEAHYTPEAFVGPAKLYQFIETTEDEIDNHLND